jgi:hypothetical protein
VSKTEAEKEARRFLAAVGCSRGDENPVVADEEYERAVRKATASFNQLQEAVRLARQASTA